MKFHHNEHGFDSDSYDINKFNSNIRVTEIEIVEAPDSVYLIICFMEIATGKTHKEVYKK